MVEVRLRAVRVDLQSNTPVLLLQETDGEGRTLPIFIGTPEAAAIAYALQGVAMPRPMTHDLIRDILSTLDVAVERVVITELRSSTYFADDLMDAEGVLLAIEPAEDEDEESPEELVGQFRQFLDSIKPEDFSG